MKIPFHTNRTIQLFFFTECIACISIATILGSCNTNYNAKTEPSDTAAVYQSSEVNQTSSNTNTSYDIIGDFIGTQNEYIMKNKDGNDMVINGKTITVPTSNYIFTINSNGTCSLKQISNNQTVYYSGAFTSTSSSQNEVSLICSLKELSNSKYPSTPTYTLLIDKNTKKGNCVGNASEPSFNIEIKSLSTSNDNNTSSNNTTSSPTNSTSNIVYSGSVTDQQKGATQHYVLEIKPDLKSASIGGGPFTSLEDQGDGSYIWIDGTIMGMKIKPTKASCTVYDSDGGYFTTLFK
jgi:hypothetical protein